nr:GGDEF domain-containing phosphodiesterase [Pseudomarimonas arenosa]
MQILGVGLAALLGLVAISARRRSGREAGGEHLALRKSSRVDPVTGLPTLDVISESFVRVLRLSVAGRHACALAVIHFAALERVQSTQSKEARDRLFSESAWRLRSQRRDEELIGAMGGDRLIMVLRVQDSNEATARLRELLAQFEQPVGDESLRFRLRPAVGLTMWPTHGDDFGRLLANALVALERCPPAGIQLFHAAQREENEHRLRVESTLSGAIAQGELGLVLQPIVDALSGEVRIVELLARWNNSELGNVSPRQFILIAESSGVIDEFDRWLLREALSTTKWMDAAGFPDIRVSLNCSPVNLADPAFMDFFERTVQTSGVDPQRLEVEVTEAALAEGDRTIVDSLLRLRALGVGLTIDDFGIGHSSLARLRDLPIDALKIDQSFVQDMGYPQGEFLVSGILGLAHGLGKTVIAEGVETEAQRAALVDLGCEYLQGFAISRPLSWRGLLDFLGREVGDDFPEAPGALQSGESQR